MKQYSKTRISMHAHIGKHTHLHICTHLSHLARRGGSLIPQVCQAVLQLLHNCTLVCKAVTQVRHVCTHLCSTSSSRGHQRMPTPRRPGTQPSPSARLWPPDNASEHAPAYQVATQFIVCAAVMWPASKNGDSRPSPPAVRCSWSLSSDGKNPLEKNLYKIRFLKAQDASLSRATTYPPNGSQFMWSNWESCHFVTKTVGTDQRRNAQKTGQHMQPRRCLGSTRAPWSIPTRKARAAQCSTHLLDVRVLFWRGFHVRLVLFHFCKAGSEVGVRAGQVRLRTAEKNQAT